MPVCRSSLRVLPKSWQQSAFDDSLSGVEPQHTRGHLADSRQRLNGGALQLDMLVPRVSPGIEKTGCPAEMIYRCDIRSFVLIAEDAGVSQIAYYRGSAVFPADYARPDGGV